MLSCLPFAWKGSGRYTTSSTALLFCCRVPVVGLDCRATCTGAYLQPVNAHKPTAAYPAPPLLCAHLGKLVNQDSLSIPKSLETEAHKFFLSEGEQPGVCQKVCPLPSCIQLHQMREQLLGFG